MVAGPNGSGKTNLLEAVYFGCTARSPRTSNERELVRRGGDGVARVVLDLDGDDGEHRIEVGFQPGEAKHLRVDGESRRQPGDDRGPPAGERVPAGAARAREGPALRLAARTSTRWWRPSGPSRADTRSAYSRALAQRNALLARIRAGRRAPRRSMRGTPSSPARHPADGGPGGGGGGPPTAVRGARRTPRPTRARRAALPTAVRCRGRRRPGGRAGRAPRRGPRARLHGTRAAPRRARPPARRGRSSAPTVPRDSSAPPCSRSCSRSAPCSPSAGRGHR